MYGVTIVALQRKNAQIIKRKKLTGKKMDNFIWHLIANVCELINNNYLYLRAERYYILKLAKNEAQKLTNFHPNQIQMTCVYVSRIQYLMECRKIKVEL